MLYIFDLDGTLRVTKSGKPTPSDIDDQEILPCVIEVLMLLKNTGHKLAIASNQGGISCGYITEMQAWQITLAFAAMCGNVFCDIKLAGYHQRGKYSCYYKDNAKPRADMLQEIVRRNEHQGGAVYVGNAFVDRDAAENARIGFSWAHRFFDAWEVVENEHGYQPAFWLEKWLEFKGMQV